MKRILSYLLAGVLIAAPLLPVSSAGASVALAAAATGTSHHPTRPAKDTTPPGPVGGLHITATALKTISLAWTNPTDADFAHVMIRRAVGSQAPTSNTDGTLVGVLGKNRTTFTDKRLTPATTYSYAVFTLDHHRNQGVATNISGTTLTTDARTGLKGRLTDKAGHPLGNVFVYLALNGSLAGNARTDSDGRFTATNLVPGSWTVCFEPQQNSTGPSATGYLPGCYRQQPFAYSGSGTPVTVTAGKITTGIADYLSPSGAISGRLIDSNGHAASGVDVQVTTTQAPYYFIYSTTSAADGSYTLKDLPTGSYPVCFEYVVANPTTPTGYVSQCWNNEPNGFPDSIPVTTGQNHTGIDATLQIGGEVKGQVTDDQGTPAVGVGLNLSPRTDSHGQYSDNHGAFDDTGIAPGHYQACFEGSFGSSPTAPYGYGSDCANPQNPAFDLAAGQAVVQNATVPRAGALGGSVSGNGAPLGNVLVSVIGADGYEVNSTDSSSDGSWQLTGFAPGDYTVCYDPTYTTGGYRRGCYDANVGSSADGTPVTVTAAQLTTVNATLAQGASIVGSITDANGGPIANVAITAFPLAGGQGFYGNTDANGDYALGGVDAGQYAICFDTSRATGASASGYQAECYDNKPTEEQADPVTVGDSGSVTVDAALDAGAGISGHVTDANGSALFNVSVAVQESNGQQVNVTTDENGDFLAPGLSAGDAYVCFDGSYALGNSTTGYVGQCWNNKHGSFGGDPISVPAGQIVTGIDASLAYGAGLSGTVTDSAGNGLSGASVDVEGADGSYIGGYAFTDANGKYSLNGLPAEPVTVCFTDYEGGANGTGYVQECWQHAPDAGTATPVSLTARQIMPGIDGSLVDAPPAN